MVRQTLEILQYLVHKVLFEYSEFFINRSSCSEVFCEKGVPENFEKFTGKHLCQRLFFNRIAGLKPATLLIKRI